MIVALHRVLIDLDGGPQTVFDELHQLNLVTQTLLQRALGQPIPLQDSSPTVVGDAIGMELADFGHAGSDLIGGNRLRRPNLFAQQFLIDQAIERRFTFRGRERVRIRALRKASKASSCSQSLCRTTWPLTLATTRSTTSTADSSRHDQCGATDRSERAH